MDKNHFLEVGSISASKPLVNINQDLVRDFRIDAQGDSEGDSQPDLDLGHRRW
jgi:hypothetical protein